MPYRFLKLQGGMAPWSPHALVSGFVEYIRLKSLNKIWEMNYNCNLKGEILYQNEFSNSYSFIVNLNLKFRKVPVHII